MIRVALTGNVASGKSTVARLWEDEGVFVVRADDLAREVVAPGTEGLSAVVEAFGPEVLEADGSLDRGAIRQRVFRDAAERRRLEALLHPRIRNLRDDRLIRAREDGHPLVVAEIPLLFEVGMEGDFDVVVLVDAPEGERLRRITVERGLDAAEARRIMDAQIPAAEKRSRADYVLENGGSREDLRDRALALLDLLRALARKGASR